MEHSIPIGVQPKVNKVDSTSIFNPYKTAFDEKTRRYNIRIKALEFAFKLTSIVWDKENLSILDEAKKIELYLLEGE